MNARPARITALAVSEQRVRDLEIENAALRTLTTALGSALQPFIQQVLLGKWKAVTDAYAAVPELTPLTSESA